MINSNILDNNKIYTFDEAAHIYYYNGQPVDTSVTQFIHKYFTEFDTDGISAVYAKKHNLVQEDVKKQWKEAGDISAMAGTIIHSFLESSKMNLPLVENYDKAINAGLETEVRERVQQLMPKAEAFIADTKDLLTPIATEYTVGLEDKLAGNIDLLAWNNEDNELQIWDYKNLKALTKTNNFQKCFGPFKNYDDCNFVHYSMQLSFYKALIQRMLNITIGKLKLVHFNYTLKSNKYTIYDAIDFTDICNKELDKLLPKPIESTIIPVVQGIYGNIPF